LIKIRYWRPKRSD